MHDRANRKNLAIMAKIVSGPNVPVSYEPETGTAPAHYRVWAYQAPDDPNIRVFELNIKATPPAPTDEDLMHSVRMALREWAVADQIGNLRSVAAKDLRELAQVADSRGLLGPF